MKILSFAKFLMIPLMIFCSSAYASSEPSVVQMVAGSDNARTIEAAFHHLVAKHDKEISSLGLSDNQLNSIVYARPSWVHNFGRFCTVREFISVLFDIQNMQSIRTIRDGKYIGFKIKFKGNPSMGFALHKDGDEFFLNSLVDDDGITSAMDAKEEAIVFSSFYSILVNVAMNNGFKG